MDLSLDDLIKKNKTSKKVGMKKKLNPGLSSKSGKIIKKPAIGALKSAGKTGLIRPKQLSPKSMDARSKIIQKNRFKIRDAREKIAENARKSIKDARELLSTSKKQNAATPRVKKVSIPRSRPARLATQLSEMMMVDDELDIDDLHLKPVPARNIKRTVRNEFASSVPTTMPKLPHFSINQELPRLSPDPFDCYVVPTRRPVPVPPMRPERIERFQPNRIMSAHMDAYEQRKSILRPSQSDDHDDRFENDRYFSSSENVRSRLYEDRNRSESAGIFAKLPVRGTSPPSAQVGHRIIISNLHTSVTESDVRELFEDVGQLVTAHLVRPGIAEVVYKNLGDAEEAVETYHNRQLDGQPMKCMLVRSSSKPSYSRM